MNQPEIFDRDIRDRDIRALQEWLRTAWRQLGDPSLTAFSRRELRNQMKQCSADLKAHLERLEAQQTPPARDSNRVFTRPELRILA
ncbi:MULTISPECIES: hypothetical protein [Bradyrhizobium]|jgi:hypothetical protein|uniref:Uncharacterized protein n=2 Tax=Bradyrhizobium TaxID=374 RepID=A0ABY0QFQ8_9BRAD|nr:MULTISPECIES: hypothetical protein [Bradyrhizobium]SDK21488.1 hypothetical protein SAMN05444163_7524 [Bradyrhizobium ottawaense]SEE46706.1 hypothetical protein SAMN05444171_7608 [Bradyrhizobium lablabi]SHM46800.1 hypothetical protein SAMN05444321_6439 [Bradyrhizobium lablabi]